MTNKILTQEDFERIRVAFSSKAYTTIWDIAWYTGRPWRHILELKRTDVWDTENIKSYILFPDNSHCPIHPCLETSLKAYNPPVDQYWLFPGKSGDRPMTYAAAEAALKRAARQVGLDWVTTHCTRERFIDRLFSFGVASDVVQQLAGGFQSPSALAPYRKKPVLQEIIALL